MITFKDYFRHTFKIQVKINYLGVRFILKKLRLKKGADGFDDHSAIYLPK